MTSSSEDGESVSDTDSSEIIFLDSVKNEDERNSDEEEEIKDWSFNLIHLKNKLAQEAPYTNFKIYQGDFVNKFDQMWDYLLENMDNRLVLVQWNNNIRKDHFGFKYDLDYFIRRYMHPIYSLHREKEYMRQCLERPETDTYFRIGYITYQLTQQNEEAQLNNISGA